MTVEDVKELIKRPQAWIYSARKNEKDLAFLTIPESSQYSEGANSNTLNKELDIVKRIKARLANNDSFNSFIRNYTFPHEGVGLAGKAWAQNGKVLEAKDRIAYIERNGVEVNIKFDLENYVNNTFFALYKEAPNSVIVIMPSREGGIFTDEVMIDNILYLDEDVETNTINAIIYNSVHEDISAIKVLSNEGYQVFDYRRGEVGMELINVKYWENKVPVTRVSTRYRSSKTNEVINVMGAYLGKLENIFFLSVLRNIIDPFAFYQMVERIVPEMGCKYNDGIEKCQNGYRYAVDGGASILDISGAHKRCTSESCNSNVSVGGIVNIKHSAMADYKNIDSALRFVSPDTGTLEYSEKYLNFKKNEFYSEVTGINKDLGEVNTLGGKTAAEVLESTEEKRATLGQIKKDIEPCISNLYEFVADIEYSGNIDVVFSLGNDVILMSKQDALIYKKETDAIGASKALGVNDMLAEMFNPNDPSGATYARILFNLRDIYGDETDKIVTMYELDNDSIVSQISQKKDISKITREIITFAEVNIKTIENDTEESTNEGSSSGEGFNSN